MDGRTWIAGHRLHCRTWIAGYRLQITYMDNGHGSQDMDTDMDRRTWIAGQGLQDMDTDMNCRTWIQTWIAGHGNGHGYRIQKERNSKVIGT